ncbi:mitochondrial mRNA pseudouridine synthase TRUB2 [Lingula anatina]|uniref:Mitochondrial mRNA pseudouridine synthase TRUB2 n=1 Tax=Lingula anatina TaxID=7574 RepID=A0A1S3K7N7_LINAN|nr:mitochondrial mRNA pseudouridine synthase TRUB2 [Lingula anatina]|eukprot:XP_013418638.1 mitochondrial mRNA pseudouridine synthase TRUB2 [Lingula anatina]
MSVIRGAVDAFGALNGVFCIYKPKAKHMFHLVNELKFKLHKELSLLPGPMLDKRRVTLPSVSETTNLPITVTLPDLRNHPRVIGDFVMKEDIKMSFIDPLHKYGTGVQLMGIADGCGQLQRLVKAKLVQVYHISGELGYATETFSEGGRLVEKSTWYHVNRSRLDRVIAMIQSAHQKHQYLLTGVDIQSQEAYNMAVSGMVRPLYEKGKPIIYNVKCIDFKPPHFTVEVHSVNEDMMYLAKLIHDIGMSAKTTATCTGIRRVRYGNFTLDHALLIKNFDIENILENISLCKPLMSWKKLQPQRKIGRLQGSPRLKITDSTQQLLGDGQKEQMEAKHSEKPEELKHFTDSSELSESVTDADLSETDVAEESEKPLIHDHEISEQNENKTEYIESKQTDTVENNEKAHFSPTQNVNQFCGPEDYAEVNQEPLNRHSKDKSNRDQRLENSQHKRKFFRNNAPRSYQGEDYGGMIGPRLPSSLVIAKRLKKKKICA